MKKEEIREWALLHWKQNKGKYMGEITNFENSSLEHWKHLQLEKPIKVLPKEYCIAINRIVTIPKLKNEIEDGLKKIGSFETDFNSFDQIKVKEAVVAMIEGYCKGGTEYAAFEQLQTHLKLSQKDVKRKSPHHLIRFFTFILHCNLSRKYIRLYLSIVNRTKTVFPKPYSMV